MIKTMETVFKTKTKDYRIEVYKTDSQSNYNLFGVIFKPNDKTPYYGTTFRNDSSFESIKNRLIPSLNFK